MTLFARYPKIQYVPSRFARCREVPENTIIPSRLRGLVVPARALPKNMVRLGSSCPPSLALVESYCTIIEQRTKGEKTRSQTLITESYLIFCRLPHRRPASSLVFLSSPLTTASFLWPYSRSLLTASFLWPYHIDFSSDFATYSSLFGGTQKIR